MTQITGEEILALSKLVFEHSGISLDKDKGYLLETRLRPLLSEHGLTSLMALHDRAIANPSGNLLKQIVEAMTTNETFFFRDNTPFDLMRHKIIPDLIDRRSSGGFGQGRKIPLRIWSAACSTGQEVYSIAMTLLEMLGDLSRYDAFILGTDISDKVVAQASYGKYNQFEMDRGLPPHYRNRYFAQIGSDWRIRDEVRSLVQFRTMNLMKPFPDLSGRFDIIFCRNVAIYFNPADKVRLFQKIARVLQPDGALIVGGSETLVGIATDFETKNYLKGIFYQLVGANTAVVLPKPPVGSSPSVQPAVVSPSAASAKPHSLSPGLTKRISSPVTRPPSVPPAPVDPLILPAVIDPMPDQQGVPVSKSGALPSIEVQDRPTPPFVPTAKKSLLASIHAASHEQAKPLLKGESASSKGSLLAQLTQKKKKDHE